jgi:hypothetical protein
LRHQKDVRCEIVFCAAVPINKTDTHARIGTLRLCDTPGMLRSGRSSSALVSQRPNL